MKVSYWCGLCGTRIREVDAAASDEENLGFHALTPDERADTMSVNCRTGDVNVRSICDGCLAVCDAPGHPDAFPRVH